MFVLYRNGEPVFKYDVPHRWHATNECRRQRARGDAHTRQAGRYELCDEHACFMAWEVSAEHVDARTLDRCIEALQGLRGAHRTYERAVAALEALR